LPLVPSVTVAAPVRLTVVVLSVSVTLVVAAAGLTASCSKLPPEALLIVVETVPASTYTVSPCAGTLTVPELAPAPIVIVAPLARLTVTGVCAVLVSDAV
jgi:hypothetical protein